MGNQGDGYRPVDWTPQGAHILPTPWNVMEIYQMWSIGSSFDL